MLFARLFITVGLSYVVSSDDTRTNVTKFIKTDSFDSNVCPVAGKVYEGRADSLLLCVAVASETADIDGVSYQTDSKKCIGIEGFNFQSETLTGAVFYRREDKENDSICEKNMYLVSGVGGVADHQLSASSYWCQNSNPDCWSFTISDGLSARFARLSSSGRGVGTWASRYLDTEQYIQVDFLTSRLIYAVVLSSSAEDMQYVTAFKLQTSTGCNTFETIRDENGDEKKFVGNAEANVAVIRCLDESVRARCVRINPTAWIGHISLRFDVLGC